MAIAGGVVGAIMVSSGIARLARPAATADAATRHHVRAIQAEQFILSI